MHHIPQLFVPSEKREKRTTMIDSNQKPRPRLERRNAMKNIVYEPPSTSSSSVSSPASVLDSTSALRGGATTTRSFDTLSITDRTSFRFEGNSEDVDRICRSLGFSGPEDFAIPMAAWEARKVRSSSDLFPKSRLFQMDSSSPNLNCDSSTTPVVGEVRVCGEVAEEPIECAQLFNDCLGRAVDVCESSNRFRNSVRVNGRNGGGIKGVRPPVLAPPPSILKPTVDNACSTWDILRSFAPDDNGGSALVNLGGSSSYSDDDEDEGVGEGIGRVSESCSFTTTSNEDDSSSSTTEPASNISPNGRFRRIITYWEKGELLGRGSFGSVYEGIADGGYFIAVKEVSLLDQGEQGRQSVYQLQQEIDLLSQFEHENIVQYYGTDKDESNLYIFLELVTKGSLLSLYRKYHLRDSQVSAYTRQILHGLKYLHDRNVVHRDIKCANILVDAGGLVKLADFGLAKATKLNDVKSCKGTVFWMAPEVVNQRNQGYGLAADIWSLGCTVLEMLTGQLPYSPLECMPALFRIGRSIPPPVPDSLSKDARDFIFQCLQVNPDARPTAAQLLDHPFVKRPPPLSSGFASPYHPGRRRG